MDEQDFESTTSANSITPAHFTGAFPLQKQKDYTTVNIKNQVFETKKFFYQEKRKAADDPLLSYHTYCR